MATRIRAQGEKWDVSLSDEAPHAGIRSVIFHCSTNTSWGWRVAEIAERDARRVERDGGVGTLSEAELRSLFERSQPFDYTHDPKADEHHISDTTERS